VLHGRRPAGHRLTDLLLLLLLLLQTATVTDR